MTDRVGVPSPSVLTPSRWRSIEPIIDAALELSKDERDAYVRDACGGDESLRAEVQELLVAHDASTADVDTPAAARFASLLDAEQPRLPEIIGGRYKIGPMLGRGGMATVFLADDLRHERQVAVKVLHADLAAALGAELFLAEIKTTAQLHHPHILPLHDSGDADGVLYYVMPYVAGGTLRRRLNEGQTLRAEEALRILTEVASALDAAHRRGVVHRDIKPENILLHDGTALVADFGIALAVRAAAAARANERGLILGTRQYMSPEQATRDAPVDARSDVFSLGVVAYEMLTGRLPFDVGSEERARTPLSSVQGSRDEIAAAVDAVLSRALSAGSAERYSTAGAFVAELRQALTAAVEIDNASVGHVRPRRWSTRWLVAAAVVLIAVVGIALLQWPRAEKPHRSRAANPRAVEYFGEGTLELNQLGGRQRAMFRAESSFKLAIALDSMYADPHAGLAHVYVNFSLGNFGDYEPEKYLLAARRETRRALELDSTVAEAHASEAHVLMFYDMDWAGVEREIGRALQLDSMSVTARQARITLFEYVGRFGDAVAEAREYALLQPRLERAKVEWGRALFFDRQFAAAAEQLRRTIDRDSSGFRARLLLGEVLAEQGKYDLALSEMQSALRRSNGSSRPRAYLANIYARIGRTAEAQRELNTMYAKRRNAYVPALDFAIAFAGFKNKDSTFAWLDRAIVEHSMRPYLFDPTFDLIRDDPRYAALLTRMHLPYRPATR